MWARYLPFGSAVILVGLVEIMLAPVMVAIQITDVLPSGWHHNACLLVSNQPFGGQEALLCHFHPLSSRSRTHGQRPGLVLVASRGARVGGFPERPPKAADRPVSRRSDQGPLKTRAYLRTLLPSLGKQAREDNDQMTQPLCFEAVTNHLVGLSLSCILV